MTFPRALARFTRGAVNHMTLHLAGHAAFADLEHVGRKSGIVRHTPVRAFRAGDTVIIGLNLGRRSDWYQNITQPAPAASAPAASNSRQGHSVVVQFRDQARGAHGRMRSAANPAFVSRGGHPPLTLHRHGAQASGHA